MRAEENRATVSKALILCFLSAVFLRVVGKSTLLDVLAGKKTGGRTEGTILINGKPKNQQAFSGYAAYVEQFDSFSPLNTVRETVTFSGRLRLSPDITDAELHTRVDRVLDQLGLRQSESAIV